MIAPALLSRPDHEAERLLALQRLNILDTAPEERFDRIVRLAAKLFRVPIAYISMIDQDRQWLKARQGLCEIERSREQSFCGHAILQKDIMLIRDAREDARFAQNDMVLGDPFVRFYAGRPLQARAGLNVGSLCLMDREPRDLSPEELELLDQLGDLVEHELNLVETVKLQDQLLESQKLLGEEKRKTDDLLRNILPDHVVEDLKQFGSAPASLHPQVCVLFADFTSFTRVSEKMEPRELLDELNVCFTEFDHITERQSVEKVKTIGDGYLCVSGLIEIQDCPAMRITATALEMMSFITRRQELKRAEGRDYWGLRIGIHSGPVVAGVVGKRKFAFDIWGDTVNTASRLEASSEAGRINVSSEMVAMLAGRALTTARGPLPVKGKTDTEMYFIESLSQGDSCG
ncbi:MAG: GAF domain-containing protein [Blastochloris sp.]|nr:GAF domain-containing protein [Blastochloris sp.]